MGTWNVSINGNDTAQDLKKEYQAAFYYNDAETALNKIDAYTIHPYSSAENSE